MHTHDHDHGLAHDLRGVQATDSNGQVTFTTIFPARHSGRWPHIHFEVYPSLATATSGYSASVSNLSQVSLATDNVFSDGATLETPTITGSVSAGCALALTVGIAA